MIEWVLREKIAKLALRGVFIFFIFFYYYYQVDLEVIWYFINIKYYFKNKSGLCVESMLQLLGDVCVLRVVYAASPKE